MNTKQEFIDLILPLVKKKLVGNKSPTNPLRSISDVRISMESKTFYYDDSDECGTECDELKIEILEKSRKGKSMGWRTLHLI